MIALLVNILRYILIGYDNKMNDFNLNIVSSDYFWYTLTCCEVSNSGGGVYAYGIVNTTDYRERSFNYNRIITIR